ncbi:MAG: phenylacetic acid degradation protein PaaN [Carbonactinosporaceae bacterium]
MTVAPSNQVPAHPFFDRHRETLERALTACRERAYWTPYPESPRAYGEGGPDEGRPAFEGYLGRDFPIEGPGAATRVGDERSPYGFDLRIGYPHADVESLVGAARSGLAGWRDAGPHTRAGVCLEILDRINKRSFEMAHAVMHTTGQAFAMAFQAGGPHAQDRGLEAVAYAFAEMTRHPRTASWEKPQGRRDPLRMTKSYTVVPRGVALVVGCNTFPTWNGYPGLFASLATGNPVVIKPHPRAVLPLAITAAIAREVLADADFDPNLVCLAAEAPDEGLASVLATRPEVRIVDFTGSTAYGDWLEVHARQAQVYTEKAGVNTVVVDSTDDLAGLARNIAFSLSLYSGQMCTTPQNILIPREGVTADGERRSFDDVAGAIAGAVEALLRDDARAVEILGAIANEGVLRRLEKAGELGDAVLPARAIEHPGYPDATVRTPLIVRLDAADEHLYGEEHFGPVAFAVATDGTGHSLDIFRRTIQAQGALTASVYSTDEAVLRAAEDAALDAGVHLSCNLTGGVYVNQSAAFSDFHATGANPAANACLTDTAFVAGRFRVVQSRRHVVDGVG